MVDHRIGNAERQRVAALEGRARHAGDVRSRLIGSLTSAALAAAASRNRAPSAGTAASGGRGGLRNLLRERRARSADEGNPAPVGRPCRARIEVHAWCDVRDLLGAHVIETDEGVIAAVADERDLRSVR
jgi:hypothetical protein